MKNQIIPIEVIQQRILKKRVKNLLNENEIVDGKKLLLSVVKMITKLSQLTMN